MTEVMGGQAIAMIANTGFKGFEEPRRADEFMPSGWAKEKRKPTYKSRQKVARDLTQIMSGLMAR